MANENKKPLAAVITAAGLSSRMGTLKALLPLGEGTVLSACVDNMRFAGAEKIIVVTGHRSEEIISALDADCVTVHNADYAATQMFDSLRLGLQAVGEGYERVIISPVDVPAVRRETLLRLPETEGEFVRPVYKGKSGHPVVLSAEKTAQILAYGGEGGLRGAIEALNISVVEVETDDEGVSVDADTPEDYRRILEIWEKR